MNKLCRSEAKIRAEKKHDAKRSHMSRISARCSSDEKKMIVDVAKKFGLTEKDLIIKSIIFYSENNT